MDDINRIKLVLVEKKRTSKLNPAKRNVMLR